MKAAEKLAQHLREHPELAGQSPESLAAAFGLPTEFVDEVVRFLQNRPESGDALREALRDLRAKMTVVARSAADVFTLAVQRPYLYLGTLFVVTVLLLIAAGFMGEGLVWRRAVDGPALEAGRFASIALVAYLAGHLACYYHHASTQIAARGTLFHAGLALGAVSVGVYRADILRQFDTPAYFALVVLVITAVISVIYGLLALAAAVLGAAANLRRDDLMQGGQTRQQMLERLMILREKLDRLESTNRPTVAEDPIVPSLFARTPYGSTLVVAALAGVLRVAILAMLQSFRGISPAYAELTDVLLMVAFFALLIAVGFWAGSVRRGMACAAIAFVVAQAAEWIPVGTFGWIQYWSEASWEGFSTLLAVAVCIGLIAGLAAKVDERRIQDQKLIESDPAAMVAEWIRIHWRVSPHRTNVTVMVVDAKASSRMKADADPLVAEYSFREYQKFIALISARWGGTVHATSGDGAVVAFNSPNEAFAAARAIQLEIDAFNRNVNRLSQNFRLRIGLHMGQLQGELDDIEFTEVIDIAAHVEAAAPAGDIAVTARVAEALVGVRFTELRDEVDGWTIFLARNPTGD